MPTATLNEAVIVDAIPDDINEDEQPEKKQRKPRSDTGKPRAKRQPADKYSRLEKKVQNIVAVPALLLGLASMRTNSELLFRDAQVIGNHKESLAKALVDVAREHEPFYLVLEQICSILGHSTSIGALVVEVATLVLEILSNHGIKINIPGLSTES